MPNGRSPSRWPWRRVPCPPLAFPAPQRLRRERGAQRHYWGGGWLHRCVAASSYGCVSGPLSTALLQVPLVGVVAAAPFVIRARLLVRAPMQGQSHSCHSYLPFQPTPTPTPATPVTPCPLQPTQPNLAPRTTSQPLPPVPSCLLQTSFHLTSTLPLPSSITYLVLRAWPPFFSFFPSVSLPRLNLTRESLYKTHLECLLNTFLHQSDSCRPKHDHLNCVARAFESSVNCWTFHRNSPSIHSLLPPPVQDALDNHLEDQLPRPSSTRLE